MLGRSKNSDEAVIDIKFSETLSWNSCSKMVVEIIKYLAYQKQQIPYPFAQLKLLVNKRKTPGTSDVGQHASVPSHFGRYYHKAAEAVKTLESIFENIEAEFKTSAHEDIGDVEEVVVLFGATPVTPKDVFRIQLPVMSTNYDFETPKPPPRRLMMHLLRCLLESESLYTMVSQPLSVTNTFVFFKRRPCSSNTTTHDIAGVRRSWFLPKENFKLPLKGRQAILRIEQTLKETLTIESPLARPLVVDCEAECIAVGGACTDEESKKVKDFMDECWGNDAKKLAGATLSNHLVFKAPSTATANTAADQATEFNCSPNTVRSLAGNTTTCGVDGLSSEFEKLTFRKHPVEVKRIEWFEARAPVRGFKDCVVNGKSAINS